MRKPTAPIPGDPWLSAMLAGDFERAWLTSDRLRAQNLPDPHRFWNGQPISGQRVIVRCLHGLGDTVQMLRYAPRLSASAAQVIWELQPRLLPLAPHFTGITRAITWTDPAPAWDTQIECMELPYLFRTQLCDLPLATHYCNIAPRPLPTGQKTVGLVWTAGDWNPARNLPFTALAPLLAMPGIVFINLQGGPARPQGLGLTTVPDRGLTDLAATIAALDLVITVDTLAAHLAGALGRPVWLMLQHEADWRWLARGTLSPWYPTMRLFRQPRAGDWPGVIADICNALKETPS